ncbi:MAG: hypothetical protein U0T82_11795 [Bacteroidales bacterium]
MRTLLKHKFSKFNPSLCLSLFWKEYFCTEFIPLSYYPTNAIPVRFIEKFKPGIPRRYLLFLAAFVWTVAGGILLYRGEIMLFSVRSLIFLRGLAGAIGGLLFYRLLFSGISFKHVRRILMLKEERPCAFSFFNWRSYFLMVLMITMGVSLRQSGIIPVNALSVFYLSMGIPLLISSFRFYACGIRYPACRDQIRALEGEPDL